MEWLENRSCTGDTPELDKKNALKGKQGLFLDPDATAFTKTSHRDGSQDNETETVQRCQTWTRVRLFLGLNT